MPGTSIAFIASNGQTIAVKRFVNVEGSMGGRNKAGETVITTGLGAWIQGAGSKLVNEYAERNLKVSHKIYTASNPEIREGDILTADAPGRDFDGKDMLIRGVVDQGGRGEVYRIDADDDRNPDA